MTDSSSGGAGSATPKTPARVPAMLAALEGDPREPGTWYRAGQKAFRQRNYPSAIRLFQASLRLDPGQLQAEYHVAVAQISLGMYVEADAACERALRIDPSFVPAIVLRGHLAYVMGAPEEGRRLHDRAFELAAEPGFSTGLPHIAVGRGQSQGWQWFTPDAETVQLPFGGPWKPPADQVWRGETDPRGTVCIYKDGGNGDLYFFARWIPAVAARVGKVFLTVTASQQRLFAGFPGLSGVVQHPTELDGARFVHLWSLPGLLGDAPEIDSPGYLLPPRTDIALPALTGLRVGLVWAGSPRTLHDHDRSVPSPDLLRPLFEVPGVDWVSLQTGERAAEAPQLPFAHRPDLGDFADTAHLLTQLDLVLTVDTAVANLAGAMGVPTWVLPPTFPEFRWGFEGDRTNWYPSVRLFRRARTEDWPVVIAQVGAALREKAGSGSGVVVPPTGSVRP